MRPEFLGNHYILELFDCDADMLNDIPQLQETMLKAAAIAKATVINKSFHKFSPHGISGTIVIAESHFNVHIWPEYGFAAVDLFTCGDTLQPEAAKNYLIKAMGAKDFEYAKMRRGDVKKNENI